MSNWEQVRGWEPYEWLQMREQLRGWEQLEQLKQSECLGERTQHNHKTH